MKKILIIGPGHQGEKILFWLPGGFIFVQFWTWENCPEMLPLRNFDLIDISVDSEACGNDNAHSEAVLIGSEIEQFLSRRGIVGPFICSDSYGQLVQKGEVDMELLVFIRKPIRGQVLVFKI